MKKSLTPNQASLYAAMLNHGVEIVQSRTETDAAGRLRYLRTDNLKAVDYRTVQGLVAFGVIERVDSGLTHHKYVLKKTKKD